MKSWDIVGYTYRADTYHPHHVVEVISGRAFTDVVTGPDASDPGAVENWLNRQARILGINREDEWSFDSGDFPKVIFANQVATLADERDFEDLGIYADRCGVCHELLVD